MGVDCKIKLPSNVPNPQPKCRKTGLQRCDKCRRPCKVWAEVFFFARIGWRLVHEGYSCRVCRKCLEKQSHAEGYSFPAIHDPFGITSGRQSRSKAMFKAY